MRRSTLKLRSNWIPRRANWKKPGNRISCSRRNSKKLCKVLNNFSKKLTQKLNRIFTGKRHSISDRKASVAKEDEEEEFVLEESDEEEGLDEETKKERRAQREVKMLANKLRSFKNKEDNAKKERVALKTQIKNFQIAMKEEKKKYKSLQKEVYH